MCWGRCFGLQCLGVLCGVFPRSKGEMAAFVGFCPSLLPPLPPPPPPPPFFLFSLSLGAGPGSLLFLFLAACLQDLVAAGQVWHSSMFFSLCLSSLCPGRPPFLLPSFLLPSSSFFFFLSFSLSHCIASEHYWVVLCVNGPRSITCLRPVANKHHEGRVKRILERGFR